MNITLVPTDELIAELFRRHDASVVLVWRDRTDEKSEYLFRWHGGSIPCLGLAIAATAEIEAALLLEQQG